MSLVSIIIPCYRQAQFLPAAIESALGQSYAPLEVLVVNDGSPDDTEAVVHRYGAAVRYIAKPNGGLSSARNAGIQAATGKYLLFLDADDLLHREAVTWLAGVVQEREDCLGLMGWCSFQEGQDPAGLPGRTPPAHTELLPQILFGNLGPVHTWLCPARLARQAGGFDEKLDSHEDWDLWVRLGLEGAGLVTVPRLGAYYRQYAGSMSKNKPRMRQTQVAVLLHAQKRILANAAACARLGGELFRAEQRVLRELLAERMPWRIVRPLAAAIAALEARGYQQHESAVKRALKRVLGHRAEWLAVVYFRFFYKVRRG